MIKVRKSDERGLGDHGWLKSRHTFSFADYYNPAQMGYSVLRVINEDRIEGGTGFDTHGHRDMEIISYVVEGALEHRDSMGTEATILPGEIQRMSAGTGVQHSEYNKLKDNKTHFLQIWILPDEKALKPGYDQKSFVNSFACSDMILVGSKSGKNGSIVINQDVDLYACKSNAEGEKLFKTFSHRHIWVQVINGDVQIEGEQLVSGDGAAIEDVDNIKIRWNKGAEFLLFDMP